MLVIVVLHMPHTLTHTHTQGVQITISTPLRTATAIRFSTGNKIEMLITNQSHESPEPEVAALLPKDLLFALHGKVETEINVALGYLQVSYQVLQVC